MGFRPVRQAAHQQAFQAALSKVAAASRRLRRRREKRARPAWLSDRQTAIAASAASSQPDPVRIAVLAMESLGRASMRASFTGVEVAVPDHATAAIFRAALSETTRTRPTDRLVRVIVD